MKIENSSKAVILRHPKDIGICYRFERKRGFVYIWRNDAFVEKMKPETAETYLHMYVAKGWQIRFH